MQIINDDNFVHLYKYYSLHSNMDRRKLENSIVRNMILRYKIFDTIQNKIPEDLYNMLLNRKKRVLEEDIKLRETMVNKLCKVNSKEDMNKILKGIDPLLRQKRREILLMGGGYEEVKKEIEEAIVKYMTLVPIVTKVSVQTKPKSLVYVQESTPSNDEKEVEETQ